MTEFWVSQSNKWCEYCKCWLKDTAQSRAVHERGTGHQENVARKLREMRKTADREKQEQEQLATAMNKVEQEAQLRYDSDRKAEEAARKARLGEWVFSMETGYYYNAVHRWYYDSKTGMYYGGDPVEWTDKPTMPHAARYEVVNKLPPVPGAAPAASRPAVTKQQYAVAGGQVLNKHPLSEVGGYQLHSIKGAVGGAKGVGTLAGSSGVGGAGAAAGTAADAKRKRGGGGAADSGKELSKEDREFLARREAARQRVQQRTAATFGLT